jgi:hypothetical protein
MSAVFVPYFLGVTGIGRREPPYIVGQVLIQGHASQRVIAFQAAFFQH